MDGFKLGKPNLRAAKLTVDQVALIKRDIINGVPLDEIADEYGVAEPTIRAIKQKRSWFYIQPAEG